MANIEPLTVGIEEEYLVIDPQTRDLTERPEGFFAAARDALGDQVAREQFRSQIEVATKPHTSFDDLHDELAHLRLTMARVAEKFGVGIIACSLHPFARQLNQLVTSKSRYLAIQRDLAIVGRRLAVCGMHVHVGIDDPDECIDLMNQVKYFLPHLLTLSTSSPMFEGEVTGMMAYRGAVNAECPRTGLPPPFESSTDYRDAVDTLVRAGVIEDATKIWWDIRPSDRFPTLEMRITDVCTRIDDAVAIAALYATILRMLSRLRAGNQSWRRHSQMLIDENRWRAMRYGIHGSLIDLARGELVPFRSLIEELLTLVDADADDLGCTKWIVRTRDIARTGTSADRQLAAHAATLNATGDEWAAMRAVVDHVRAETLAVGTPAERQFAT